jgi:Ca-activated chloride channel family protein
LEFSHPDDDFFVIHFNESIRLGLDGDEFSADRNRARRALWRLHPDGQTALYDAVEQALNHSIEGRWEKRALLVISDGGDTASSSTFDEVLEMARGFGTPVYGIGVYDPMTLAIPAGLCVASQT